jgi:hypothetical protein
MISCTRKCFKDLKTISNDLRLLKNQDWKNFDVMRSCVNMESANTKSSENAAAATFKT